MKWGWPICSRAADTIADTGLIGREQRLRYLNMFRAQFAGDEVQPQAVGHSDRPAAARQTDSAERVLLQRLPECLALFRQFDQGDRERIRWLMEVLPNGMEMDLTRFPGSSANELTALERPDELDRYTYFVAGCAGEFWTAWSVRIGRAMAHWDVDQMSTIGVRSAKGCS